MLLVVSGILGLLGWLLWQSGRMEEGLRVAEAERAHAVAERILQRAPSARAAFAATPAITRAVIDRDGAVEHADVALRAVEGLRDAGIDLDPKRLAASAHAYVRNHLVGAIGQRLLIGYEALLRSLLRDPHRHVRAAAAAACGALVDKEAVPALIELLRDGDHSVRQNASESLTRIRFFHEQQAHWDRVLEGLDASPASAAEKLLLQAKPGEPAEQRILAIRSLGTLGAPEALPFLIDWTKDADAAIATAAKNAITQVHLNPRR